MSISIHDPVPFGEILDAVAGLPAEDQLALVDIVKHRLAEQARKEIAASVQEARKEFPRRTMSSYNRRSTQG